MKPVAKNTKQIDQITYSNLCKQFKYKTRLTELHGHKNYIPKRIAYTKELHTQKNYTDKELNTQKHKTNKRITPQKKPQNNELGKINKTFHQKRKNRNQKFSANTTNCTG